MNQHRVNGDRRSTSFRKSTIVFAINNQVGGLAEALKVFQDKDVNILHIESRKSRKKDAEFEILVDLECDNKTVHELIATLKDKVVHVVSHDGVGLRKTTSLDRGDTIHTDDGIPWFPKHISELDRSSNRVLMYGAELDADHPGFKDEVYRKRRKLFAEIAFVYKHGQSIPRVDYTDEENKTWGTIYRTLTSMYPTYACKEYNRNFPLLVENCGYCEDNLPQLDDISRYLKEKTGFQLRPVAGYLSSRDFLAGLAFRVFHCTQYIRHSSDPFYTPEPDCCHELLGHMPLFLDASFAEFSQEIGLASLGASDEEVQKLATCYFFTIEFGLCKQNGEMRVYGAGLLSSVGELKHVLSGEADHREFEPDETVKAECQITQFQDQYFYTNSFEEAKDKLRRYAKTIKRPFELAYDPYTQTVEVLDTPKQVASAMRDVMEKLSVITSAMDKSNLKLNSA